MSPGIYSITRWGWENPKPRFWHFEPWFPKVLEIFENTLLYITAGSFGSGGGGEGFYIRLWCGGRGMRFDRHSFPSNGCNVLWRSGPGLYTWPVRKPWWSNPRHRLTLVAHCFTGLSLPHPPKPPSQIDSLWQGLGKGGLGTDWARARAGTRHELGTHWARTRHGHGHEHGHRHRLGTGTGMGTSTNWARARARLGTNWAQARAGWARADCVRTSKGISWIWHLNFISVLYSHYWVPVMFGHNPPVPSPMPSRCPIPPVPSRCPMRAQPTPSQALSQTNRPSELIYITRDLQTPMAMPLQPPRTWSGPDRRCAGIRTSHVYPQVISPGIYSLTRRGWENPKPWF